MTRPFFTYLGLATALLAACAGAPLTARIVVFTASEARIPRNTEVTLLWQAADAGVQDGFPSCVLTRRLGDDLTETPVQTTCTGTLTEVPPAPLGATTVEYRFKVLKQSHDATDPYLTQARSVTLDAALYATRAGGANFESAQGVSTLADGSAIITGTYTGTATFGTTTLTTAGLADVFVARIDPDGAWAWAQSAGGTSSDEAFGVSSLADGGAIVTGSIQGTATFGTTTLTSAGGDDAFVARIGGDGAW